MKAIGRWPAPVQGGAGHQELASFGFQAVEAAAEEQ
jgi:hypothetical protein